MSPAEDSFLNRLREGLISSSPGATEEAGRKCAGLLPADCVVALHGDLGTGKTTFVRGLASGFGINKPITSPTFTLHAIYQGNRQLVHLDAYRLESAAEMDHLMLEDFLQSPWCLAVEWPDNIREFLPGDTWHFELGVEAPGRHRIRMLHPGKISPTTD
ncbi:MAG: tRNA (adenosine(37)-N6)-threonylcarbamoyltransferase complex ATPase subunit type 1 TsaE [Opitutales bacterium]